MGCPKQLKRLVFKACLEAKKNGYEIVADFWGSRGGSDSEDERCCCALTALALKEAGESFWEEDGTADFDRIYRAVGALGFSEKECHGFIRGFDGDNLGFNRCETFWAAGLELAGEMDPRSA